MPLTPGPPRPAPPRDSQPFRPGSWAVASTERLWNRRQHWEKAMGWTPPRHSDTVAALFREHRSCPGRRALASGSVGRGPAKGGRPSVPIERHWLEGSMKRFATVLAVLLLSAAAPAF